MSGTHRVSITGAIAACAVTAITTLSLAGVFMRSASVQASVGVGEVLAPASPSAAPSSQSPSCPGDGSPVDVLCKARSAVGSVAGILTLPVITSPAPAPAPTANEPPRAPAPAPPPAALVPPDARPGPLQIEAVADFTNAAFLQSLLDVLAHPLGARHPDLRHFHVMDSREGGQRVVLADDNVRVRPPMVPVRPPVDPRALAAQVLLPALLVIVVLAARHRRVTVASTPRAVWLCLGGAVAGVALGSVAAASTTATTYRAGPVTAVTAAPAAAPRSDASGDRLAPHPTRSTLWEQLVGVEGRLRAATDRLTVLEADIQMLLGSDVEPVGLDHTLLSPDRVARLVGAHEQEAAVYRQCVESEYDLYRHAAEDPQQREELMRGEATVGEGAAAEAIAYNLQVMDTQLVQERRIARAEAILERYVSQARDQAGAAAHGQPFIAPEGGPLTQGFGPTDLTIEPPLVYHGAFYPHFHTGIDLAAPLDTPLHAAADGVVLLATASRDSAGRFVGYGNYVLVGHPDGFATLYGHLDRVLVMEGMVVRRGQVIGLEGSTGWSTGPHVHFEIRYGHELLDPLPLVREPGPA